MRQILKETDLKRDSFKKRQIIKATDYKETDYKRDRL